MKRVSVLLAMMALCLLYSCQFASVASDYKTSDVTTISNFYNATKPSGTTVDWSGSDPSAWRGGKVEWYELNDPQDIYQIQGNSLGFRGAGTLSGMSTLKYLSLTGNSLTSLNASNNSTLIEIRANRNQLTSLNVTGNSKMDTLYVQNNDLSTITGLGTCSALKFFNASDNNLSSLDLRSGALITVRLDNNSLTSLDLSNRTNLLEISVKNNQLTSINLQGTTKLETLGVDNNKLTALDLSSTTKLEGLSATNNQLTSINLSGQTILAGVYLDGNKLSSIDVSTLRNLQNLSLASNNFSTVDVRVCPKISASTFVVDMLYCFHDYHREHSVEVCDSVRSFG